MSEDKKPILRHQVRTLLSLNTTKPLNQIAIWAVFASTLTACTTTPVRQESVSYQNPPSVGSYLQSQRELVACETTAAAQYMVDFGFFHPQCRILLGIGPQEVQVTSRELVVFEEGPSWMLGVQQAGKHYIVPIPWHNWL